MGRMRNSSKDDEVRKVMEMLSNLKLNLRESDSLCTSVDENATDSDVEQWFNLENNDDVWEASISDIADDMEQLVIANPARDIEDNECEGEVNEVTASHPSLTQSQSMFSPIQESAFLCNLPDASAHLQRALNIYREAVRRYNANATRQLLITEMFPRRSYSQTPLIAYRPWTICVSLKRGNP